MEYHIVSKDKDGQILHRMVVHHEPLPHISWTANKEVATEFEKAEAKRLLDALEPVVGIEGVVIEPANDVWLLKSNTVVTPPYLVGYNFSGPQWSDSQSKAMKFDSQEKAEEYSQALKTLFDIHTTPTKLT